MLDDTAIRDLAVMLAKALAANEAEFYVLYDHYVKNLTDWAKTYGEHEPQDETDL